MTTQAEGLSRGKITELRDGVAVFAPSNSNYQLHLGCADAVGVTLNTLVDVRITADARKVWTVPSGGNFITPIHGTPRIIQGRVRQLSQTHAVIQSAALIHVKLPEHDHSYDLNHGPIEVGKMLNVTLLPGAALELGTPVHAA